MKRIHILKYINQPGLLSKSKSVVLFKYLDIHVYKPDRTSCPDLGYIGCNMKWIHIFRYTSQPGPVVQI